LIERVARSEQGEDVDVLMDSRTLRRKDGPSDPEEGVGFIGADVGHETVVSTFRVRLLGNLLIGYVRHPFLLRAMFIRATRTRAWR
jgi:hypothetical protein